ncbi:hypothetical protein A2926_03875 [Candidatus Giovannonibacteria bacterium RIFCSPLOWO2_01_FULL_44_40]|uniref:Methyltransferase domain-containing protein n=1 Tax=Candidatus Giovannonibacteria bacterium RIFCSPHIGHO2_01_FULL_45_23 TaxID=1798325 RepID=A0A1F5VJ17_9BACT|nr:MAG: hypothetical protein A2834_04245 [Candidatus Giovannonibacteria bacterium RIFCSPHIGHO2_01_FULL_45_23]OGF75538.1 MAG: hypothetical protein A3C77_00765 [Candidatus Giovannonibacteria bacterium RIFCSPHIGHO2_02_FULL_45_13]OGF80049.1 MAG: hypothetical protein A2926_03875 [Candidatus Giovannonibacteria bacterium RIFCSPLOWO2_01_FULL_44_40]
MAEAFLNPDGVIEAWDVRPGDKVADFGCGAGFFSVPLGSRVGSNGKIYALDIRPEALEATRAKVKLFHIFNIEPSRADLELPRGSGLRDGSVDKVLISNILFQAENKKAVADEAYRILKAGGSVMVVEWEEGGPTAGGPSLEYRVGKDEAKKILESAGFSFFKEFSAGSNHYGMIFSKK